MTDTEPADETKASGETFPDKHPSKEDSKERKIQRALAQLPDDMRRMFQLRVREAKPIETVAAIMELTREDALILLSKANQAAHEALVREGVIKKKRNT